MHNKFDYMNLMALQKKRKIKPASQKSYRRQSPWDSKINTARFKQVKVKYFLNPLTNTEPKF